MSTYYTYQLFIELEQTLESEANETFIALTERPDHVDTWKVVKTAIKHNLYRHARTTTVKNGEEHLEHHVNAPHYRQIGEVRISSDFQVGEIQLRIGQEILTKEKINYFLHGVTTVIGIK